MSGIIERLTRQRQSMMGEFEGVLGTAQEQLGTAQEQLEQQKGKSQPAEELAGEELPTSLAQRGGAEGGGAEGELERLRAAHTRRQRSMLDELEAAHETVEVLSAKVAELEAEIRHVYYMCVPVRALAIARVRVRVRAQTARVYQRPPH